MHNFGCIKKKKNTPKIKQKLKHRQKQCFAENYLYRPFC